MDEMVLKVQQWLNETYDDINIAEDGYTGQGTVGALIKALQHELNKLGADIAADGDFGAGSYNAFVNRIGVISPDNTNYNLTCIVQGACWCKGYSPKSFDGVYGQDTMDAIIEFQVDAGVVASGFVGPAVMKALLNTDGFKRDSAGDDNIREVQRFLNGYYSETYGSDIGLIPTNGIYERKTSTAMIYAVQIEGGAGVDGLWGNGTKNCLPVISEGSTNLAFVKLLQCALTLNKCYSGALDGEYDSGVTRAVKRFQQQMALTQSGNASIYTWCALLVSCGDRERSAKACDCATKLTAAKAKTLVDNGYEIVGRYLTGTMAGGASKALTNEEIQIAFDAGLRIFPIFETSGDRLSHFSYDQGLIDAADAINAACGFGFPNGTTIYFAVDVDALQDEIEARIIPYFNAVNDRFARANSPYLVGVYGTRNVCSNLDALTDSSFVADMSYGWSGNMGFSMPMNWAFDQFATVSVGSGEGMIEIDKDAVSGADNGVPYVDTPSSAAITAQRNFINHAFQGMPFADQIPVAMEIGKTYTLFDLGCLKAEVSYNTTMSTEQPNSITIRNGELDSAKLSVLEGLDLSADLKEQYLEPLKSMGISVSNGIVTVGLEDLSLGRVAISITVSSDDIDVEDGTKTTVSATFKYTMMPTSEMKKDFEKIVEESAKAAQEGFLMLMGAIKTVLEEYADEIAIATVVVVAVGSFLKACASILAVMG